MKKRKLPMLPPIQCDDGCGDCCGPVPASAAEYAAVVSYVKAHDITPHQNGLTCPFYQGGKCTVYAVRPVMCRVFGHDAEMGCSRGYNTNVAPEIVRAYVKTVGRPKGVIMLHQALVDWQIVADIEASVVEAPPSCFLPEREQ